MPTECRRSLSSARPLPVTRKILITWKYFGTIVPPVEWTQFLKRGFGMACKYLTGLKIPGCLASERLMHPSLFELKTLCNGNYQKCALYWSKDSGAALRQPEDLKKEQHLARLISDRRIRFVS